MKDISEFCDGLQELLEAEKLLKEILVYYDIYTGEFDNKKLSKDDEFKKCGSHGLYYQQMNQKIRKYIKFDDSE